MTVDPGVGGLVLGPPGVYLFPEMPLPRAAVERLDVAAFAGVSVRGPAFEPADVDAGYRRSVPIAVDSWDEYAELFGGFEGPGLLPFAVAAYFAQGGRRAYVIRAVAAAPYRPDAQNPPPGCATYRLLNGLEVRARNEGTWGNRLTMSWSYETRLLTATVTARTTATEVTLDPGSVVVVGSLLRLGGDRVAAVERIERRGHADDPGADWIAVCPPGLPAGPGVPVELVEGQLEITDSDPLRRRSEVLTGLGLLAAHPRYVAEVLRRESRLVAPLEGRCSDVVPDATLGPVSAGRPDSSGADRFGAVVAGDVLTAVRALADADEAASIVVPDLFAPAGPPRRDTGTPSGRSADFRSCAPPAAAPPPPPAPVAELPGLVLDPGDPWDLAVLADRQRELLAVAEELRMVVLLDVPPGLTDAQTLRWRSWFASSYAAAYHPWLRVPGPAPSRMLVTVPPSAVAAGIVARCERRDGLARGPANEAANQVVGLAAVVPSTMEGALHRLGINVFGRAPDGVRLNSARTLSADPALRQLTARRVLMEIERVIRRQLAWTVFEPSGDTLRAGIRRHLQQLLDELSDAGAFAGGTAEESWFVTVGAPDATGPGQLVVEVGVAPASPLEFVLVRVVLDADGVQPPQTLLGRAVLPPASLATGGLNTGGPDHG
ncbi:phage tail sheath C-terminal domain-containing protein [Amycolatopsis kentuckyensis]|uniref:phage tail sheath C-terminal domain-containing protein n=1 Tax=Amycolatopsis kentuckyensis TaxID=218823 RepID=UPI000A3BECE7|nr:phage tail sheath C-terminal domain-containing protein [Amycolatopsis kentuckyensis]